MAAVAQPLAAQTRREHQEYVAALLDRLEELRRRIRVRQATVSDRPAFAT